MLINLPTHQQETVGARFAIQQNPTSHKRLENLYYLSFFSDLFREKYQKEKLTLRYKILRSNHLSDLARQKINILMDLIIGESKDFNTNYNHQINPNQLWSNLCSDNPYKIPYVLYVETIFKDILEITFKNQDYQILTLILDRLLEISLSPHNSKRQYFTSIINDKIAYDRPCSNYDFVLDQSQMILVYIKWSFKNKQVFFLFKPLFEKYSLNYYHLNEIIQASLISRNYQLLYQIRLICDHDQKLNYFIHNLLEVITKQLYLKNQYIFPIKSEPESSVRQVMPIVYDYFQKLNRNENISEEEFINSLEFYLGPVPIHFYGRNYNTQLYQIDSYSSEKKSQIIEKAEHFLELGHQLIQKLNYLNKNFKIRTVETTDTIITITIQRNYLKKLISYCQNQITPF